MSMDEDIKWMLKAKQGDLNSFEKLYEKYASAIRNFFLRLGCTLETSQDYAQEVFMRLWRARETYEPRAKFTTFLFQIAKNYWINQYEKKKKRPFVHSMEETSASYEGTSGEVPPDKLLLSEELSGKIHEAVQKLNEKYRLVFVLSELEGLKYKEISDILEIPVGTVKSRMATAEKQLREKLSKYIKDV